MPQGDRTGPRGKGPLTGRRGGFAPPMDGRGMRINDTETENLKVVGVIAALIVGVSLIFKDDIRRLLM